MKGVKCSPATRGREEERRGGVGKTKSRRAHSPVCNSKVNSSSPHLAVTRSKGLYQGLECRAGDITRFFDQSSSAGSD